ncbi:DUF3108 domain-containing protein [bacterium]|nr:MAG: DUF3108 domain-containing protein [bacterium]
MRTIKYILLFILVFTTSYSQNSVLEVGEELYYKVYFGFITLGEVKFKITGYDPKTNTYSSTSSMKSYEGIPFINLDYIFESTFFRLNDSIMSRRFYSTEFKQGVMTHIDYDFDYERSIIKAKRDKDWNVEEEKQYKIIGNKKLQDGLSLFYNARLQSMVSRNYIVPVYINGQESSVNYSFNMNKDVISSDLAEYDISAVRIIGTAQFTGVYGLTGEFVGWLSDDSARIPLKAKFNVTIGSVTLELSKYKRKNWKPPVYNK